MADFHGFSASLVRAGIGFIRLHRTPVMTLSADDEDFFLGFFDEWYR